MPLFTVGISHHTAPIEVREKVAITQSQHDERVRQLRAMPGVEEIVILCTCNRMEIYCLSSDFDRDDLLAWIHEVNGLPKAELEGYFYAYQGEEVARHLICVACGLDSLVVGETQILGQLKEAWQQARDAGSVGRVLDRLFQHTFSAAKTIRTQSGISERPVSVAYTAVVLARQIFGDLNDQTVALIGAGEMIQLCGRHLQEQGIARLLIVNRSLEKARALASEFGAEALTLEELDQALPKADILISSTASPEPVIRKQAVKAALRQRRHRPMFLVDIAVPRDIEPGVSDISDVYLYTIDDLQQVVDENLHQRNKAAEAAHSDVEQAVDDFMRWLYGIRAARSLRGIRQRSHAFEKEVLEKALRKLEAGHDPAAVLKQMASTLTNKILHAPSKRLREAAECQDYEVLTAADRIFRPDGQEAEE